MFMFSTLLASKLVRIVTRTVKEACGVPTVAMCRSVDVSTTLEKLKSFLQLL